MPFKNKSHAERQQGTRPKPVVSKGKTKQVRRADAKRYDKRWRQLSVDIRKKEPLCRECTKDGRTSASRCVDHIVPIEQGGDMYDEKNLQPLCWSCHSKKTAAEDGGFGNKKD